MKIIDYVDIKPAVNTSWHLVTAPADISGYNCAILLFTGTPPSGSSPNMFHTKFRPTGVNHAHDASSGAGGDYSLGFVALDANDQFEISCNNTNTACWIIGGMTDAEATVFTYDWSVNDLTPTATDSTAENIDISSYLGGDTAIAAIVHVRTGNGQRYGYAYDTVSTPDILYTVHQDCHVLVPVNSGLVRLNRDNSGVSFRLAGYIKSGITLNPTRTPMIPTVAETFEAVSVPDRTTEDIVFLKVGNDIAQRSLGRETGEAIPYFNSTQYVKGQIPLRVDINGEVEIYRSSSGFIAPEWFATNDTGGATTYTIDSIDGDNDVQAGQPNVDIVMSVS